MTGSFLLDWAILSISLLDTILMFWLGLMVLLTAERRTWGVWLIGASLLTGGAFFISHSALIGYGLRNAGPGLDFWWHVGWGPVVILPFAWYVVVLWYTGFWEDRQAPLYQRQRPWLTLTSLWTAGLIGLLIFANPLPSFSQVAQLTLSVTPEVGGLPLLIVAYPVYIVACIALSLDALRRPGPSARVMGDAARRRARPWLIMTAIVYLGVSLLVAWVMVWLTLNARGQSLFDLYNAMTMTVGWFDLIIESLLGFSVILLGQAVVAYEVFTGRTLPRRGLRRYWRNAVILGGGYGAVVGFSLTLQLRPIYSLLLTALLMTVFYALLSWRSYAERERYMHSLRPFVANQPTYVPAPEALGDAAASFRALCREVLGVRRAYLLPVGPLAPLVSPLAYPEVDAALPPLDHLLSRFTSPQTMCLPFNPEGSGDASWAVPLWSERGLIGVLLLGEKSDGGLYTQEEIEIAQASGERLIDTQASAELARRLMSLQRQRLAESQLLDHRARRVLHDEVLPNLHAALLLLDNSAPSSTHAIGLLTDVHRQLSGLLHAMPPASTRLGLLAALRQTVDEELRGAFDEVFWQVAPEAEERLAALPTLTADVVFYAAREALRNAARHARRPASTDPLRVQIEIHWQDELRIVIEDDGVGVRAQPADEAGGQGLALHSAMLAVVGGTLAVEAASDGGTRVRLMVRSDNFPSPRTVV